MTAADEFEEGQYASAEDLTRERQEEGDHVIPGVGRVRLRGMSREELLRSQAIQAEKGTLMAERYILSRCTLKPKITEEIVAGWQRASMGMEINDVALKVNALSGVRKSDAKSGVREAGGES